MLTGTPSPSDARVGLYLPTHPLLIVQGPVWAFLAATRNDSGETVSLAHDGHPHFYSMLVMVLTIESPTDNMEQT